MRVRPWRLAAVFALIAICCGTLVMIRPRGQGYPLTFPGGKLRKITYFNDGGKIYEVRAFDFLEGDEKEAREIGRRLQKEGNFAFEKDFTTGEVFVYTVRTATQQDYFREWAKSGGAVKMINGPAGLVR